MKTREEHIVEEPKVSEYSFIGSTKNSTAKAGKVDYNAFCDSMYLISNYKTMVLSEKAYAIALKASPKLKYSVKGETELENSVVGRTKDGDYIISIGTTSKFDADHATMTVNANKQHMDRYQHNALMELANPGRGLK